MAQISADEGKIFTWFYLRLSASSVQFSSDSHQGTLVSRMAQPVIVIDPEVMNGTPCFRGTRVPFKNLIDYLEGGHSLGEFLRQFPTVSHEMAIQVLQKDYPQMAQISVDENKEF